MALRLQTCYHAKAPRCIRPCATQAASGPVANLRVQASSSVALKEWNVAIAALHRGGQTFVLRKGGIKEPVFRPPGKEFLLFPTSFHSEVELLKPGLAERYKEEMQLEPKKMDVLPLTTYVQVTGAWTTEDPAVITALDDMHMWTQGFVDARLKWRGKQPLTLLELRAWRLAEPLQLQLKPDHFGCFSFLDLKEDLDTQLLATSLDGAQPALTDSEFAAAQDKLRSRLAGIAHQELQL